MAPRRPPRPYRWSASGGGSAARRSLRAAALPVKERAFIFKGDADSQEPGERTSASSAWREKNSRVLKRNVLHTPPLLFYHYAY